jgi:hypothetical protein
MALKIYLYPSIFSSEDWGLVTSQSVESVDLGQVSTNNTDQEDYGLVTTTTDIPEDKGQADYSGISTATRTFDYNESSVGTTFTVDDYGADLVSTPSYEDYGSIENVVTEEDDYGNVSSYSSNLTPFGSFSALSGSAVVFGANPPDQDLIITISGSAVEKNTESYVGVGTFSVSGSAIERFNPSYVGTGVVASSDALIERVSYDYNEQSILLYQSPEDFGGISTSVTIIDDYGSIADSSSAQDTYGSIGVSSDRYPFGTIVISGQGEFVREVLNIHIGSGTIEVSGIAIEKNTESYVGVGTFSAFSGSAEVFGANPPDKDVTITISGSAVEKNTESYVGVGTFNASGSSVERNTESYVGVGTFNASGSLVERNTFSYVGVGTFSAFGGAAEVYGANPPDNDVTITISGEKVERRTYSYNELAVNSAFSVDDYGADLVTVPPYEDYGSIENSVTEEDDYGNVSSSQSESPFGLFVISGDAITTREVENIHIGSGTIEVSGSLVERNTESYVGVGTFSVSGSLDIVNTFVYIGVGTFSAFSGSAEVFGANPPDKDVTITISGSAIEKNTESYVGVGTFSVSGSAVEKNTESYIGVGTFSAFGGAAEVYGANPPDNDVLITISGEKIERRTYSYNELVVDSTFTTDDYGADLVSTPLYEDYGSIENSVTEEDDYGNVTSSQSGSPFGLFNISGSVDEQFFGAKIQIGSGSIEVSGSLVERNTESYVGVGTFSAFSGSAESFGPNPPDQDLVITISGEKIERVSRSYVGLGTFSSFGGSSIVFGANPPDKDVTITISGEKVERTLRSYVGVGTFSAFSGSAEVFGANPPDNDVTITISGEKVERRTYSYNELAVDSTFSVDDYGADLVSTPLYEDYGSIENSVTEEDDYGNVTSSQSGSPFGLFVISGDAITTREVENIHIGSGTIEVSGSLIEKNTESYVGVGTFNASGSLGIVNTFVYIGLGTFSSFGGSSIVFGANPPENDVTITISGEKVERTLRSYVGVGTFNASGSLVERNAFSYVGLGTFSAFSGSAEVFGANPPENDVTITISGEKVERRTYSYNELAVDSTFTVDDYGADLVSTPPYEDYGSITNSITEEDDYGNVTSVDSTSPFGLFNISGSADEQFFGAKIQVGSGTIEVSGSAIEKNTESYIGLGTFSSFGGSSVVFGANPPDDDVTITISGEKVERTLRSYVGVGTFDASGSANTFVNAQKIHIGSGTIEVSGSLVERNTESYVGVGTFNASGSLVERNTFSYVGVGTFSSFGGTVESVSYDYNEQSIFLSQPSQDYGGIGTSVTIVDDYGSIADSTGAQQSDYGSVAISSDRYPFGSFTISGFANESFTPSTYVGVGTFNASGSLVERNTFSYVGLGTFSAFGGSAVVFGANPPDKDVIITISGEKIERISKSYVGTSDNQIIDLNEDTGSEDFGSVDDPNTSYEDAGGLLNLTSILIEGTVTESFVPTSYQGSGSAEFFGSAKESFTPTSYIGLGTFSAFGGSAVVFGANPPDDDVTITISGEKVERRTYSYNELAIDSSFTVDDYGADLVSTPPYEDYGSIENSVTEEDDYGNVTSVDSTSPFGLFNISGSASTPFSRIYTGVGTINASGESDIRFLPEFYIGSGSFSFIGGAAESFGPNPPEDTRLFSFSGSALDIKLTHANVGFGTFSAFSGSAEVFGSNPPDKDVTITISGSANESFTPTTYIGFGSFSAFGGASEVYGANPPDNDVTITISGDRIERKTHAYVGFTSLSIVGGATGVEFTGEVIYSGSGQINIDGIGVDKNIKSYVGLGAFSSFGGSAEVIGINPPDNDVLITISGQAETRVISVYTHVATGIATFTGNSVNKAIFDYSGSGSIQIEVDSKESFTPTTYIGLGTFSAFGGAAEVYGANPPDNDVTITISGEKIERRSYAYDGVGTLSISGSSDVEFITEFKQIGSGTILITGSARESFTPATYNGFTDIQISGSLRESYTPATEIGSGSFSAFGGAAEVFGANPPDNDVTITISGSAGQKNTESYVGFGTFSVFSGSAESFGPNPPDQDLVITISGEKIERVSRSYVGLGTFSSFGGSAEAFTANPEEDTRLFTFSGSANVSFITEFKQIGSGTITVSGDALVPISARISGSGSIGIFSGSSIAFGANPPESDLLFSIFGNARESFTPATYIGFGTAIFSGIATDQGNPFVPGTAFIQII